MTDKQKGGKTLKKDKTEMLAVAMHQLKTALTTNKWAINFILSNSGGNFDSSQKEALETINESNERAIKIVKSMLLTERKTGGAFELNKTEVDIEHLIRRIVKNLEPEAKKRNLQVKINVEESQHIPKIKADEEKMSYVFENIIGDAILYTKDNGEISIKIEEKNQKTIQVSVSDTGIGIPKEDQKNVFKKFFRSRNAKEMALGGTGLGLFISKKIVEKHDGKIGFESTEGIGTVFAISLPIEGKK